MSLLLIRHGATDSNGARYIGRQDLPLNSEGRQQADAVAVMLANHKITRIWVSPLTRAIQTAAPLAKKRGLAMERDQALVEFDFGGLEGQTKSGRRISLRRQHAYQPVAGGESLFDVWCRLEPLAERARAQASDPASIAIFGHYWSLRLLRGRLLGYGFEQTLTDRSYKPAHTEVLWLA